MKDYAPAAAKAFATDAAGITLQLIVLYENMIDHVSTLCEGFLAKPAHILLLAVRQHVLLYVRKFCKRLSTHSALITGQNSPRPAIHFY